MKKNISKFKDCYGCGVCVISCPVKIISYKMTKEGFYTPYIQNQDKCIECGICLEVCSFNYNKIAWYGNNKIHAYGGWSLDPITRKNSTSGGIGYELSKSCLKENFKVCGVKYNLEKERAEHCIIDNLKNLEILSGSKYIPSHTVSGFSQIKKDEMNLVIGLPCQIDSFRRYINKFHLQKNFILVDMLCHGTPSLKLWRRTLIKYKLHIGCPKLINFRNKIFGWHQSDCIEIKGINKTIYLQGKKSLFYKFFYTDLCLNKCCSYSCKYKLLNSSADIRLGDFWGAKYKDNQEGVNVILTLTEKGEHLLKNLKNCKIENATIEEALENQMKTNAPKSILRSIFFIGLNLELSLNFMYFILRIGLLLRSPFTSIKNMLKKNKI